MTVMMIVVVVVGVIFILALLPKNQGMQLMTNHHGMFTAWDSLMAVTILTEPDGLHFRLDMTTAAAAATTTTTTTTSTLVFGDHI